MEINEAEAKNIESPKQHFIALIKTEVVRERQLLFFGCARTAVCHIRGPGPERSSAWLEHLVWDQDVAGSNPVAPTTFLLKPAAILRTDSQIALCLGIAHRERQGGLIDRRISIQS